MRVPGVKKANLFARWLSSRRSERAVILGYHRVADDGSDPYGITVQSSTFEDHLRVIRRLGTPVSLSVLLDEMTAGRLRSGTVAVTFDDAYSDVLTTALPLLTKYEIPATVFAVSGALGDEFWWDRLARLVNGEQSAAERQTGLTTERDQSSRTDRTVPPALKDLYKRFLRLPEAERMAELDRMESEVLGKATKSPRLHQMSPDALLELSRSNLMDVGSHTVSHPVLPSLSARDQRIELEDSKRQLEHVVKANVTLLSYPNGQWNDETAGLARDAGYHAACTSVRNVVTPRSDLLTLPRIWPDKSDADELGRLLTRWL